MGKQMDQDKLKALAAELAKDIKSEKDLGTLTQQLIKLTVETALNAEMDVQQYSFATTEGVHYTITMNQDPDSKSERFNIRLLTLDTSSAPLIFMKSVHLSSGGQYFDCDMSLKIPSCANNEQPTNGVVYLKAYPVHQIY